MELQAVLGLKELRYLAQDESRVGRKTETKRVITAKGTKPKVKVAWPREAFWLYGVDEPLTGWQWTQQYDKLDSEHFQQFLNALSQQLGDTTAVMQMDQASAHCAQDIVWPENIIPILQPAHCPELNPIERLWQHLKGLWKGETFASLDELRQRVNQEFESLSIVLCQARSLGSLPSNWIAKRFSAGFQSRMGIVHFLDRFWIARYTTLSAASSLGKMR